MSARPDSLRFGLAVCDQLVSLLLKGQNLVFGESAATHLTVGIQEFVNSPTVLLARKRHNFVSVQRRRNLLYG